MVRTLLGGASTMKIVYNTVKALIVLVIVIFLWNTLPAFLSGVREGWDHGREERAKQEAKQNEQAASPGKLN